MTREFYNHNVRRLAQAVILQAVREACSGDLDALQWLASQDTADTWLTVAGINRRAVLLWLQYNPGNAKTRRQILAMQ